jgi:hypothetical protein
MTYKIKKRAPGTARKRENPDANQEYLFVMKSAMHTVFACSPP